MALRSALLPCPLPPRRGEPQKEDILKSTALSRRGESGRFMGRWGLISQPQEFELDFHLGERMDSHPVIFQVHPQDHPPAGFELEYVQSPG